MFNKWGPAIALWLAGLSVGFGVGYAVHAAGTPDPSPIPACEVEDGGPVVPCAWDAGVPENGSGRREIILYLPVP